MQKQVNFNAKKRNLLTSLRDLWKTQARRIVQVLYLGIVPAALLYFGAVFFNDGRVTNIALELQEATDKVESHDVIIMEMANRIGELSKAASANGSDPNLPLQALAGEAGYGAALHALIQGEEQGIVILRAALTNGGGLAFEGAAASMDKIPLFIDMLAKSPAFAAIHIDEVSAARDPDPESLLGIRFQITATPER